MTKISIITISYNNLEGLKRTVHSVLSQSYKDYEYIVVDGGSNDGSKEYLEANSAHITRWVSEPDKGIYNAMNKGIAMATGKYCIFMNSGDHFFSATTLEDAAPQLDGTDYCVGRTIVWTRNTPHYVCRQRVQPCATCPTTLCNISLHLSRPSC